MADMGFLIVWWRHLVALFSHANGFLDSNDVRDLQPDADASSCSSFVSHDNENVNLKKNFPAVSKQEREVMLGDITSAPAGWLPE